MIKPVKPMLLFDKKVRTKDDLQFVVVALLLLLVIFSKGYMMAINREETTPVITTSLPNLIAPFINTHYSTLK